MYLFLFCSSQYRIPYKQLYCKSSPIVRTLYANKIKRGSDSKPNYISRVYELVRIIFSFFVNHFVNLEHRQRHIRYEYRVQREGICTADTINRGEDVFNTTN